MRPGELGAGDRASESAFWFNAYSAYLGCDNQGPEDCEMVINGFTYQDFSQEEVLTYQQNATIPACTAMQDCKLQLVEFAKVMTGLTGLQITAFVGGAKRIWFMDNLSMGWYNNTCAAGLLRQRSQ